MGKTTQYFELPDLPKLEARPILGLPSIPVDNSAWPYWEESVLRHRITVAEETSIAWSGQQQAREEEVRRVKRDGRYWLSTYGSIYQARPEEDFMSQDLDEEWDTATEGSTGWVTPFIPYTFQLYYWDLQQRAFRTKGPKGDVAIVKSRQMGMSNIACAIFSHSWMTKAPFQGRLLSRKEDLVDESNNPDSLFWKIKLQLQSQPEWMLQAFAPGFDWRHDYMLASLTNPVNKNHLAGESTNATAGRGGAATVILLDEYAFMRGGGGIWTATRAATRHRIAISTVNLKFGPHFYDLVHPEDPRSAPTIMHIPYYLHPYHDEAWRQNEELRDTAAGFQVEVMMNWYGDESEFVYPMLAQKEVGDYNYAPYAGPLFLAIDDGIANMWAMHVIQYIQSAGRHRIIDSYHNKHKKTDFYGAMIRGLYLDGFEYGEHEHAMISLFKQIEHPIVIMDLHGKNMEQVAGMSVIERLASEWGIYANVDSQKRDYVDRREVTDRIVPFTDFNDTPRVRQALRYMRQYKWKSTEDGVERTTEYRTPIINDASHYATAFEYYAGNFDQFKSIYNVGSQFVYE